MTRMETSRPAVPLTPLQWTICAVAALGFAFDSYELLMLPIIVRPALADLLGVAPNSLMVNEWVGTMQYIPAVAGGIFGLLGGYLTDLLGRRRVLVWSILLYAISAVFTVLPITHEKLPYDPVRELVPISPTDVVLAIAASEQSSIRSLDSQPRSTTWEAITRSMSMRNARSHWSSSTACTSSATRWSKPTDSSSSASTT